MMKIDPDKIIVKVLKITKKLYDKGDILIFHKDKVVDLIDSSPFSFEKSIGFWS